MSSHRPVNELSAELAPINGLNAFHTAVSSPRQAMFTGNLAQFLIVDGRTRKRIQTGLEREISKGQFRHEFDRNVEIIAVIPMYPRTLGLNSINHNPLDVVIYEEYETGMLGMMELSRYHSLHQHYGFKYDFDDAIYDNLTPGRRIEKGALVAKSPAVTDDGDYMYGLQTNVVMFSDPGVTEDGIIISDRYAERIRTTGFEKRILEFGRNQFPINLYGTGENYKPFADIGDRITGEGMVACMRGYDVMLNAVNMSARALMRPDYSHDERVYGVPNARVIDISVEHNDRLSHQRLPKGMDAQLRKYYDASQTFYMEIVKIWMQKDAEFRRRFRGTKLAPTVPLEPQLNELVTHAIAHVGEQMQREGLWKNSDIDPSKVRKHYRGELMDEWKVEITYEYKNTVGEGQKLTNQHGAKGVSVSVWPHENMPRDKFGNVAEVAMYDASVVNRLNPGSLHEQAVSAAMRDVVKRIRRKFGLPDMGELDFEKTVDILMRPDMQDLVGWSWQYLLGFYEIVAPLQYDRLQQKDFQRPDRMLHHLAETIVDGMYLFCPPDNPVAWDEVIRNIRDRYMPEMSTLTYVGASGKRCETKMPILIGEQYFLVLEKTATDWSGVSSAKMNHFGIAARLTNADKYSSPGRQTGNRTDGEAEVRGKSAAMGADVIADQMDMNNNPTVHKHAMDNLLTADQPTNIDSLVDRERYKYGGHRPLNYVKHMFACSGKAITNA